MSKRPSSPQPSPPSAGGEGEDSACVKFTVRIRAAAGEKTITLTLKPGDNSTKKFKAAFDGAKEILSVEWTHRHYVQDNEYIPHGEAIEAFLKREIAKQIIR